jgi:AcrR family transcriptional regulator
VVRVSVDRDVGDLTAKARIRDAALRLFTEQGFEAATIRGIAAAAGVSPGLVRHHFGSKEALRAACDAHALERALAVKEEVLRPGGPADPAFLPTAYPAVLAVQRYLARSLVDGSPAAASLFETMIGVTEQWMADGRLAVSTEDPPAFAAALLAMATGLLMLREQVSQALGADILEPAGQLRLGRVLVDIYSQPLLTPAQASQARAAYEQLEARLAAGQPSEGQAYEGQGHD